MALSSQERERNQYPTTYKVGNIRARIYKIEMTKEDKVVKYMVRNEDYRFTDKFNCHDLVPLQGGTSSYPNEHLWDTQENSISELHPTTLRAFIKKKLLLLAEKQKLHSAGTQITNVDSTVEQEEETVYPKVVCSTCEELISITRTRYCSGCKKFIHKLSTDCPRSGQLIQGKGKKIYCNIYCANNHGIYPVLNSNPYEELNEDTEDDEQGGEIDLTADTNSVPELPIVLMPIPAQNAAPKRRYRDVESTVDHHSPAIASAVCGSSTVPMKKIKLNVSKNSYYEIPYDELKRTNEFIIDFITKRKIQYPSWKMTTIRWNAKSMVELGTSSKRSTI